MKKLFFYLSIVFGISALALWILNVFYPINILYALACNIIQLIFIILIKYSKN